LRVGRVNTLEKRRVKTGKNRGSKVKNIRMIRVWGEVPRRPKNKKSKARGTLSLNINKGWGGLRYGRGIGDGIKRRGICEKPTKGRGVEGGGRFG